MEKNGQNPKQPIWRGEQDGQHTSKIRQFSVNNRSCHLKQLTIAIKMIQALRNVEIDEIDEKVVVLKEDSKGLREKVREAVRK